MTMRFRFFTEDLDGADVQLYAMAPLIMGAEVPVLVGTQTISNGVATFSTTPLASFAVRVRESSDILARTGRVDLSTGTMDSSTGEFVAAYFLLPTNAPVVITPAQLGGLVPSLPQTSTDEDGAPLFRLDSLTLTITGNTITATGAGEHLQTWIGGAVTFTYLFRLVPNTGLLSVDRLVDVETVSSVVRSANGGLLGFLINVVGDILLWILRDKVAKQIEASIQAAVDEAVEAELDAAGAGAGITVTVRSLVTNTTTGITVNPLAMINAASVCPSGFSSGSIRLRAVAQIRALAAMRDRVLRGSPRGELYLEMFRKHRAELTWLLVRHPELLKQADTTVARGLRDFSPRAPEKGVMSEATAREAVQLLEMTASLASPELAALAASLIDEVRTFVGKSVAEVLGYRC